MKISHALELFFLAALWGGSFLFMKIGAPEFGTFAFSGLRLGIAALFLLPFFLLAKRRKLFSDNLKPMIVVGVINSAIPLALFAYATQTLTAGYTSVINATAPIWGAIIAILWYQHKSSFASLVGLGIGIAGVATLVWDDLSLTQGNSDSVDFTLPIIAGLLATLCYGIASNYSKKALAGVDPMTVAAGSMLTAALSLLPLTIYYWPTTEVSTAAIWSVIIIGTASTGFAYILYYRLIEHIGPTNAITVTFLIPGFGMMFGHVFLDEVVEMEMLIGCGMILLGTGLTTGVVKIRSFKKLLKPNS